MSNSLMKDLLLSTLAAQQILSVAESCHNMNRAYCKFLGDDSQPEWEDASSEVRASVVDGVKEFIKNYPNWSPEQAHESWTKHKLAHEWVYGETKDSEAKTHPYLVPYSDLSQEQRLKDTLFFTVCENEFASRVPGRPRELSDGGENIKELLKKVTL